MTRLNPDKMSEKQEMRLALANQKAAARRTLDYANMAAADVQGLGQAAQLGGMFYDTSAAAGMQNPYTAQQTKQYMGMVTDVAKANLTGVKKYSRRMNMPYWQQIMNRLKGSNYSYGSSATDSSTTGDTATGTSKQSIL